MRFKSLIGIAAAAAMAGMTATTAAQALDDVSVRLNWYLVGFHVPLYLGKEKGYFEEEGINLTINEGRGSVVSVQSVGSGEDTFGYADSGSVILAAAKGMPVISVAAPMNTSPFGIISLAESGIDEPKDLEGKRLAVTPGDALTQLFPAVVAANDLDGSSIETIFVDPAAKVVMVLEKQADALLGSADAQFFQIEEKGPKAAAINFADVGVNTIGMTIVARKDLVEDNPDLIRRFLRAFQKSYEEGVADPDAAVAAAVRAKPDASADVLKGQFMVNVGLIHAPETVNMPIGYATPEMWEHTFELMKGYRDLVTEQPVTDFYTNELIPGL